MDIHISLEVPKPSEADLPPMDFLLGAVAPKLWILMAQKDLGEAATKPSSLSPYRALQSYLAHRPIHSLVALEQVESFRQPGKCP